MSTQQEIYDLAVAYSKATQAREAHAGQNVFGLFGAERDLAMAQLELADAEVLRAKHRLDVAKSSYAFARSPLPAPPPPAPIATDAGGG